MLHSCLRGAAGVWAAWPCPSAAGTDLFVFGFEERFEVLFVARQWPPPGDGRVGIEQECAHEECQGDGEDGADRTQDHGPEEDGGKVRVSLRDTALPTYLGWMMDWITLLIPP